MNERDEYKFQVLFLSQKQAARKATGFRYQAPVLFYDRRQWKEDRLYFNDANAAAADAKAKGWSVR